MPSDTFMADKPSNKIPRLDNDANAPTLSQFECDDPEHLDIVMRKKTTLVLEEMFWVFHLHQPNQY